MQGMAHSHGKFGDEMSCRAIAGKSLQPHPVRPTTSRNACRTLWATLPVDCLDAAIFSMASSAPHPRSSGAYAGATASRVVLWCLSPAVISARLMAQILGLLPWHIVLRLFGYGGGNCLAEDVLVRS